MPLLELHIGIDSNGGWLLQLGPPGTMPVFGRISAAEVARIAAAVRRGLTPPVVVHRATLGQWERAEEQAGRALARVLSSSALARTIGAASEKAHLQGEPLVIAVHSASVEVRGEPWELLACGEDQPPLERGQGGLVVRLGAGTPAEAQAPARALRALIWCPTPEDPACVAATSGLRRALASRGIPWVDLEEAMEPRLCDPVAEHRDVLVMICHGQPAADGQMLLFGDKSRYPGSVADALRAGLRRLGGVLLGVCGGGTPTTAQLDDLAGRLLLAGAPLVVTPAIPVSVDALLAFADGWAGALGSGEGLVAAVQEGHRQVEALHIPHPDSRPYTFQLHLSALDAPRFAPWTRSARKAPRWANLDLDLDELLGRATSLALQDGLGFLGLEHLMRAWRFDDPGPLMRALSGLLIGFDSKFIASLHVGLRPIGVAPANPVPSPRLDQLLRGLPATDANADSLARALMTDPNHGLHAVATRPLGMLDWGAQPRTEDHSARLSKIEPIGAPADGFEVVWGPEDGRVVVLAPGQTIGHYAEVGGPTVGLYQHTSCQDHLLHRQQLRYLGPGQVALLHRGTLFQAAQTGQERAHLRGEISLYAGDLIQLTPATWLRAIALGAPDNTEA